MFKHSHTHHSRHDRRHARFEGRHGRGMFGYEHEGHHGPGGGRRMFGGGELRFVVLALLAEQPRHGYEIIKAIEERLGGGYSPSPGVIYPTLTMLEELGYATVAEQGGKKLYTVTAEGLAHLEANRATADAALGRMDQARAGRPAGAAPPVVRAMENLKLALRLRLQGGPLTDEQVQAIAAALDAAALSVERS